MAAAGPQVKKFGKVIRIISKDELVVNLGSIDGIYEGQTFEIIKKGEQIVDPETGQDLGGFPFTAGTLTASMVEKRFSILRPQGTGYTPFQNFPVVSPLISRESTHINIDESSIEPISKPLDMKIVVGDTVKTM